MKDGVYVEKCVCLEEYGWFCVYKCVLWYVWNIHMCLYVYGMCMCVCLVCIYKFVLSYACVYLWMICMYVCVCGICVCWCMHVKSIDRNLDVYLSHGCRIFSGAVIKNILTERNLGWGKKYLFGFYHQVNSPSSTDGSQGRDSSRDVEQTWWRNSVCGATHKIMQSRTTCLGVLLPNYSNPSCVI